jgi:hypothetical protein
MPMGRFRSAVSLSATEGLTLVRQWGAIPPRPLSQSTYTELWGPDADKGCRQPAREPFLEWEIDELVNLRRTD